MSFNDPYAPVSSREAKDSDSDGDEKGRAEYEAAMRDSSAELAASSSSSSSSRSRRGQGLGQGDEGLACEDVKATRPRVEWKTEVKGHAESDTFCCAWSRDGKMLATGVGDGSVRVFNSSGKLSYFFRVPVQGKLPTTCVKFRHSSAHAKTKNVLLVANSDGSLSHWHVSSQTCLFSLQEEDNQLYGVDCSGDGLSFATCGMQPCVRVYDEATKVMTTELSIGKGKNVPGHSSRVYSVKFHPQDDNVLVSGGWDNTIQIWDVRAQHAVRSIYGPHICGDALSIHPTEGTLLTASHRPELPLELWDLGSGKLMKTCGWTKENPQMLFAAQFSPCGSLFAAGGTGPGSNEARLFDYRSFAPVDVVETQSSGIYSLAFDADSTRLAFAGAQSFVTVMDL
jgi:COMPASS component SWD3